MSTHPSHLQKENQLSLELLQRALIFEPDGQLLHYQIASGCFMRVRFVKDLAGDLESESLVIRHGKRMIELHKADSMPLLYLTLERVGLCAWMLDDLEGHQTLVISALKRFRQVNKISDKSSWSKELKAVRMPDEWHFGTRLNSPI